MTAGSLAIRSGREGHYFFLKWADSICLFLLFIYRGIKTPKLGSECFRFILSNFITFFMPVVKFCTLLQLWKPEITLDFPVQLLCQNWALDIWHELSSSCLAYCIRYHPYFIVNHTVVKPVKYISIINKELKGGYIQEKKYSSWPVCIYSELHIIYR